MAKPTETHLVPDGGWEFTPARRPGDADLDAAEYFGGSRGPFEALTGHIDGMDENSPTYDHAAAAAATSCTVVAPANQGEHGYRPRVAHDRQHGQRPNLEHCPRGWCDKSDPCDLLGRTAGNSTAEWDDRA